MFVVGTFILTLGMFFCALTVETSSKKHDIPLPDDSRVYWVQPGNQMVGDQVFPPFVGCTKKGALFIRSVKHHSQTEILNYGKELSLLSIVMLAMVGFVMQFIGLRGLHSSITLAQLGSTMIMTLIRTSLRAQRMHEGDNMLENDEVLVLSGSHELDWLTFSLLKIQSFRVCPIVSTEMYVYALGSDRDGS
jgi:FlaA1/EpsC-like NDP-sugar epimerase